MNKPIKKNKRERGVALILALAMMTLLMVMAMAFSFSSRSELQVSSAFRDINLAKLNAMDAINTGIHHTQRFSVKQQQLFGSGGSLTYYTLQGNFGYGFAVPRLGTDDDDGVFLHWNEYRLTETNDMSLYFTSGMEEQNKDLEGEMDQSGLSYGFNFRQGFRRDLVPLPDRPGGAPKWPTRAADFKDTIGWRHIRDWDDVFSFNKNNLDVITSDKALTRGGAIKGRSLWLASCESLKLDINTMLREKSRAEEIENGSKRGYLFSFDHLLKTMKDDIDDIKSDDTHKIKDRLSKEYKREDLELKKGSRLMLWDSIEQMWNAGVFENEADAQLFAGYFSTYGQDGDIEAFYETSSRLNYLPDYTRTPARHRFYIGDLATTTVEKLLDPVGVKSFWEDDIPESTVNGAGTPEDGHMTTSIPWLSQMIYDGGSFNTRTRPAANSGQILQPGKQVAANLIDYSDGDSKPTTNYTGGNPVDTDELYCGLEKVPYISSIKISADSVLANGTYSVDAVKATVTIIALYKNTQGGAGTVTIYTNKGNKDAVIALPTSPGATSEAVIDITQLVTKPGAAVPDPEIQLGNLGIVLKSGTPIDLCRSDKNSKIVFKKSKNMTYDAANSQLYGYIVFPDPRANTNLTFNAIWTDKITETTSYQDPTFSVKTLARKSKYPNGKGAGSGLPREFPLRLNNQKSREEEIDMETSKELKDISTLYIRNGIMKTHWELGAVSRGEPFRTINLKVWQFGGGNNGRYRGGDAQLCDEIKLRADTLTEGKPNFAVRTDGTQGLQAFNALARSLLKSPDDSYDLPTTDTGGDYVISDDSWDSKENQTGDFNKSLIGQQQQDQSNRVRLAQYFNENYEAETSAPHKRLLTNDKQREEVYGKLVDMFSGSSCHYQMIGTGEEVKHMEMSDAMSERYADWQNNSPEKVPKNWVFIRNEGWYKILGRVKIMCRLRRDLRTEYIKVLRQEIIND